MIERKPISSVISVKTIQSDMIESINPFGNKKKGGENPESVPRIVVTADSTTRQSTGYSDMRNHITNNVDRYESVINLAVEKQEIVLKDAGHLDSLSLVMIFKKIFSPAVSIIKLVIVSFLLCEISYSQETYNKYFANEKGVVSIMYHRFNETSYPSTNIQMDIFKEHINTIKSSGYKFISAKQFSKTYFETLSFEPGWPIPILNLL